MNYFIFFHRRYYTELTKEVFIGAPSNNSFIGLLLESNEKKGVIVNTDETTSGQQKKEANTAQSSAEHTIALRELEKTVDKLINSITKVSQDGKFEGKEIKTDIEKLSKVRIEQTWCFVTWFMYTLIFTYR